MKKLDGKIAVVTGGSTGIGLATAQRFVAEGAYVFITGRRKAELEEAVRLIGGSVTAVQGDVANLDDLDRLYAAVKQEKGRVDVVFANAGILDNAPLGSIAEEQYDKVFNVNVKGLLFTVQKALPMMSEGGTIVLNASIVASKGFAGSNIYSASKAAVRSFARTWASDLKGKGIRVNAISPGPTETPVLKTAGLTEEQIRQHKAHFATTIPLGRMGQADEVAKVALFLACDDSSFMTGSEVFVDGGLAQV